MNIYIDPGWFNFAGGCLTATVLWLALGWWGYKVSARKQKP